MPSRPIQGFPIGFLSLLGLKNLGKLPEVLVDEVRPTLEVSGWYLRGAGKLISPPNAGNATGGQEAISIAGSLVPEGEVRYVHWYTMHVFTAVAPASLNWWTELAIVNASGQVRGGSTRPVVESVTGGGVLINTLGDFWMYPGETLTARWTLGVGDPYVFSGVYATSLKS